MVFDWDDTRWTFCAKLVLWSVTTGEASVSDCFGPLLFLPSTRNPLSSNIHSSCQLFLLPTSHPAPPPRTISYQLLTPAHHPPQRPTSLSKHHLRILIQPLLPPNLPMPTCSYTSRTSSPFPTRNTCTKIFPLLILDFASPPSPLPNHHKTPNHPLLTFHMPTPAPSRLHQQHTKSINSHHLLSRCDTYIHVPQHQLSDSFLHASPGVATAILFGL
mmetsp:Transcript_7314/g.13757  ORF Transcript_7314/g.13757 Transcript_7314/m.13757 type:complete len:216 (+) Transcript_7314:158-805(+)